jgi:hypothetical protein
MPTKTNSPWSVETTKQAASIWKQWTPEVYEPLGIKTKTATKRADKDGKGGTRAAMLAVMTAGYQNAAAAAQLAACIRHTFLGCTATNTNGIMFAWFSVQSQLDTVASNAVFKADAKGTWQLVKKSRVVTKAKVTKSPTASANGPVVVVRPADKALATVSV